MRLDNVILGALRRVPHAFPGKRRLARLLYRPVSDGKTTVVDTLGFHYDVPDVREPVAFDLAVDGFYEPKTLDVILRHLPRGGVFVDVGANIGAFALPAARHVGSGGRVIAIEASPQVFPFLAANVSTNGGTNIVCVEAAAVRTPGAVSFFVPPATHFGMGALAPQFHAAGVMVNGVALDAVLASHGIGAVDVLKIDVEGAELGVLQGAEQLLRGERPPVIVMEFCDWAEERMPNQAKGDAQRLLLEWGFTLRRLDEFVDAKPPLAEPIVAGFEVLVAERPVH